MHPQRERIIAGNWKMNGRFDTNWDLLDKIAEYRDAQEELLPEDAVPSEVMPTCILFPPALYISQVADIMEDSQMLWGTQNISQYPDGAYTGELSAEMLRDFDCTHVLVGHSERRTLFGETNEIIAQKFLAAKKAELIPVLCIGETLVEREAGRAEEVLAEQLSVISDFENSVIAYEPVWAIGTGIVAGPEQAQEMHAFIRGVIASKYSTEIAESISILYGGSCNPSNAKVLFSQKDIDGGLIGGASLDPQEFLAICRA